MSCGSASRDTTTENDSRSNKTWEVRSCPPRGGLVQGWASVCWGEAGFSYMQIKKSKCLSFLLYWFRGSLAYWFRRLLVSWFLGFFVSWVLRFFASKFQSLKHNCFFLRILISYYQIPISCFLEDIEPILPKSPIPCFHRSWLHISLISCFDGYWSHIQDFQTS